MRLPFADTQRAAHEAFHWNNKQIHNLLVFNLNVMRKKVLAEVMVHIVGWALAKMISVSSTWFRENRFETNARLAHAHTHTRTHTHRNAHSECAQHIIQNHYFLELHWLWVAIYAAYTFLTSCRKSFGGWLRFWSKCPLFLEPHRRGERARRMRCKFVYS